MDLYEKYDLINELLKPFGYTYDMWQDVFSTRIDAWQRKFGYCSFYDKAASKFKMIFDCIPVYFYYHGKTWLIELWKGQYGINTGCEIGIYYVDDIVDEDRLSQTLFSSVKDKDIQNISFYLLKNGREIAHFNKLHWWLTAFLPGEFSRLSDLAMEVELTLADYEMAAAFARGLVMAGYDWDQIHVFCNKVKFSFAAGTNQRSVLESLWAVFAQESNWFWCCIYRWVTRPFVLSLDRVLYLYFYFPYAFRKLFQIKRVRRS